MLLPPADTLVILVALALAALVAIGGLTYLRSLRPLRPLADVLSRSASPPPAAAPPARASVVVAACNEEQEIESTVRAILAQRSVELTVVVVDDRSTDRTRRIVDHLAAEARTDGHRLTVIHNDVLPDGWIGKVHALSLGAAAAHEPWVLFTDGDVRLARATLLAETVALAEAEGLDHVAVIPDTRPMSLVQEALMIAFGQAFLIDSRTWEMDRDRPRGGAGVGAFNLVRRTAFDRIGGFDLLRLEVGDDYRLGRLIKESGGRQRIFLGHDLVLCRWHVGPMRVIRGLEKNLFGGAGYSVTRVVLLTALLLLVGVCPLVLAAAVLPRSGLGPAARLVALGPVTVQAVLLAYGHWQYGRRHRARRAAALLYPLGLLLLLVAVWNSTLRTLARGGIVWRGTFYPLAALRAGRVRDGAGRRFRS